MLLRKIFYHYLLSTSGHDFCVLFFKLISKQNAVDPISKKRDGDIGRAKAGIERRHMELNSKEVRKS